MFARFSIGYPIGPETAHTPSHARAGPHARAARPTALRARVCEMTIVGVVPFGDKRRIRTALVPFGDKRGIVYTGG